MRSEFHFRFDNIVAPFCISDCPDGLGTCGGPSDQATAGSEGLCRLLGSKILRKFITLNHLELLTFETCTLYQFEVCINESLAHACTRQLTCHIGGACTSVPLALQHFILILLSC